MKQRQTTSTTPTSWHGRKAAKASQYIETEAEQAKSSQYTKTPYPK